MFFYWVFFIQVSKVRSDHAVNYLNYFSELFDVYQLKNLELYLWKFGTCDLRKELMSYYHVFPEVWLLLTPNKSGNFHFYNSHLLAETTRNIILVGNGESLAHLSVIAKRYNSPMRSDHAFTPNILVSYHILTKHCKTTFVKIWGL